MKSNAKEGIIIGAIFVVALVVIVILYIRRREITFEGEVVDKDVVETAVQNNAVPMNSGNIMMNSGGGVEHQYRIKVKTNSGKVINYKISEGMYEIIKIGDRVSKPKGSTEVSITSSASTPNSTPPTQAPNPPSPTPPQSFA